MKTRTSIALACLSLASWSGPAFADVDMGEDEAAEAAPEEEGAAEADAEAPAEEGATDSEAAEQAVAEAEKEPAKFLFGARYRIMVVPQFLINAFGVDGGRTVVVHGGGPEIGYAQKNFEVIFSPWFAGYSLEPTPFKGKNDDWTSWEIIESSLSMAYLTIDLMWKQPLTQKLDLHIGLGAGAGIVFGGFSRTEAYWANPNDPNHNPVNPLDPNQLPQPPDPYTALYKCSGPNNPIAAGSQCPIDGNYGTGVPWGVYPWLTFQFGLRYAIMRELITRLDLGVGSSGFWLGLGVDYGL